MGKYLSLPINREAKILHITDTHLFADDSAKLLGINTNISFRAVIEQIENSQTKFDLIVATGDFVQDGSEKAYSYFVDNIKKLDVPCVWIAGNHDIYSKMEEIFCSHQLPNEKVILLGQKWVVILLNSQVEGKAYGILSQSELDFLTNALNKFNDRAALVFLHHHPILSGCEWLDEHNLKNSDSLELILKQNSSIKAIGWGHIHQKYETIWHKRPVFSTPSTCVQFKPNSCYFQLSNHAPAWRIINLHLDGSFDTMVHHLLNNIFQPDMTLGGY